jgi:D-3-phosphoglycerate dehydrogenase / 2-oxoglutarate reductase
MANCVSSLARRVVHYRAIDRHRWRMDVVLMSPFVAVTDSPAGGDLSVERAVLPDRHVEKVAWHDETSLSAAVRHANAIMCMHAPLTRNVIQSLTDCRVIVRFGTGLDNIDLAAAKDVGVPVVGIPGYCTSEVADHAMALLLAWNRRVVEYHRFVTENRWSESRQTTGNRTCGPITRLSQQTLGILGFGQIGRALAQRALAFGMKVFVHSRRPDPEVARQLGVQVTDFEDLLTRSDYVSLHLPLSRDTKHLINADRIKLMKPGTILINTSRGGLVDEKALASALLEGSLGGALLDVFERAPLAPDHPFRTLKNVILTPHVAFYSEDSLLELRRRTAEAILRYV